MKDRVVCSWEMSLETEIHEYFNIALYLFMPETDNSKPEKISQVKYHHKDCYFDRSTCFLTSKILEIIFYQENLPSNDKKIFNAEVSNDLN